MALCDDTSAEAEKVQIDLLRKAGPVARLRLMRSLSRTMLSLSYRAVSKNMPGADQSAIDVRFVEVNYGKQVAKQLQAFLCRRASE